MQNRFIRKQNTRKKKHGDINLETLTGVKILDLSFVKDQASVSFFFSYCMSIIQRQPKYSLEPEAHAKSTRQYLRFLSSEY